MVTAFAPNKRVDLAIDAFNELGLPLKIIGGGSEEEISSLKSRANDNIEFLGRVSREEVIQHYAKAKAFIFPGVEDFGITPLEAMAAGTPVVAYKAGGVLETLTDATSIFFSSPKTKSLIDAVSKLKAHSQESLKSRADEFKKERFTDQVSEVIK